MVKTDEDDNDDALAGVVSPDILGGGGSGFDILYYQPMLISDDSELNAGSE